MEAKLSRIPNYLKASSPIGLRRLMLRNNIRLGAQVSYFQIVFDGTEWIAWFYEEVTFMQEFDAQMNSNVGGDSDG